MRAPFVCALLLPAALVASMTSAIPPPLPSSSEGLGPKDGGTWPQNGALGLTQTYVTRGEQHAKRVAIGGAILLRACSVGTACRNYHFEAFRVA